MPEYLDPEIANEGEPADFQPMMAKPVIPTYDNLPSIKKYFPEKSGIPYKHRVYPAWLYHATEPPVLVRNAEEAKKLGVVWRDSTHDERAAGWPAQRWDFTGEWRPIPYSAKFDPSDPGAGKEVVLGTPRAPSQTELVGAVVAAVLQQMRGNPAAPNALAGPAASDPDYAEFQEFKRWKESNARAGALSKNEEKAALLKLAEEKGIKIDGRSSIERIKEELDKFGETGESEPIG